MSFFNSKEEVLDLQLTQYGKYLLSRGKFKPQYYAFFDDNVVYDSLYANFSESHTVVKDRIIENTLYNKTQYVFSGIESNIKKIKKQFMKLGSTELIPVQSQVEKYYTLTSPLGNSSMEVDKKPYLELYFLEGDLHQYTTHYTGSHATLPIPQLSSSITFKSEVKKANDVALSMAGAEAPADIRNNERVYQNLTLNSENTIIVRGQEILIDITEFNSDYTKENFEIEMFIVKEEDLSGSIVTPGLPGKKKYAREVLEPLRFGEKFSNIENNLLLGDEEVLKKRATYRLDPTEDPEYTEYYFEVLVDEEIDLCRSIDKIKQRMPNYDIKLKCPDAGVLKVDIGGIYGSDVTEEDCETCQV
tara:strand:+ start:1093 stop:2169 length:1077 start_codon:yes stop_codon:yes gene_type:complete